MTDQQPTPDTVEDNAVEEQFPADEVDYESMTGEEQDEYDRLNNGPRVGSDGELYDYDGKPL